MKKNILILVDGVDETAPGIVFERLINSVNDEFNLFVACIHSEAIYNKNVFCISTNYPFKSFLTKSITSRISTISVALFGYDISSYISSLLIRKSIRKIEKKIDQLDFVISFVSYGHTGSLLAGDYYKKKLKKNIKFGAYIVDAIPAPLGWSENNSYYKGMLNFISKKTSYLDILISSNIKMMEYQKALSGNKKLKCDVLYNPVNKNIFCLDDSISNQKNFVYTGGIYGKRKISYMIEALKIVLTKRRDVYLILVGSNIKQEDLNILDDRDREHLVILPFSQNLTKYYSMATALLDIDADIDNDIYLSSKISNYLALNRVILSETGIDSPSRNIFKGIPSIIQCDHNPMQIAKSMELCIKIDNKIDFSDRNNVLVDFGIDNFARILRKYCE